MHADAIATPRIESRPGSKVGSFRDLHGAALAVHRLIERGHAAEDVFVRPHRMEPLAGTLATPKTRHLRRRAQSAALVAASLGGGALALTGGLGWATVAASAGIALAAAMITVASHRIGVWRIERRRRRTRRLVRAGRFDVVVTKQRDDAEHHLATWWDPEAAPAGSSRSKSCR